MHREYTANCISMFYVTLDVKSVNSECSYLIISHSCKKWNAALILCAQYKIALFSLYIGRWMAGHISAFLTERFLMHFSSFNTVMINSCLRSITVSADKFDNMTCSYILSRGRNPRSILKWQLTDPQIRSCREPFCCFTWRMQVLMSPNELCCNNRISVVEILSTHHRYQQCSAMTTEFDAIFDYANAPNK